MEGGGVKNYQKLRDVIYGQPLNSVAMNQTLRTTGLKDVDRFMQLLNFSAFCNFCEEINFANSRFIESF